MAESSVAYLLNKLANFLENDIQLFGDQLTEEILCARGMFERINAHLRIADSMEDIDPEVKEWIKQIRDAAHDLEDALDEFKLLSAKDQGDGFPSLLLNLPWLFIRNMKARYRIVSQVRCISSRIKSICDCHGRLKYKFKRAEKGSSSSSSDAAWNDNRGDALLLDEAELVGIEGPRQKLVQWLIEGLPRREAVSIWGMGGLGKTTLVKQVYEDPAVKKHFPLRVWVSLSHTSKKEELLKGMLQQIATKIRRPGPKRADTVNGDLLRTIIKDMLRNRRYLIVLDDVWHVNKWNAVKYAFPNDENGSRVMLTTRHGDIASDACIDFEGKKLELKPLPEEQSWKLFCRKTFKGNACPPNLEDICKFILKKCEGLPLPIVAISGVLASRDVKRIDEWDIVQRSLRSEIDGNDRLQNLKKVLSLSFRDLPYYLKSCFLHLSVFPEGQVIDRMRLIRLWVAEGFVETKEGKTPEEVAEDYLNELLDRSLLQVTKRTSDGRVKLCRIHHLLQSIGITKSKEQNFATRMDEQSATWPDRIRRLSIHNKYQPLHQTRSLSQLRSLLMFGVDKSSVKSALLCDLKLLNVLDLQSTPLKKFPLRVVDMCSLTYLSLRGTEVKSLPSSIGKLENLETLDLKHTCITELPIEIVKLQRLRHLIVYRYETVFYAHAKYGFKTDANIGCLQSLQKLSYVEAGDERSRILLRDIGKLTQLRRLCILNLKKEDGRVLCSSVTRLSNLRALSISPLEDDEFLDLQALSPPPLLQRIYLRGRLKALPHWIATLSSLTTAHLRCCRLKDDPLVPLQNLPNLVHLELQELYDWKTLHFDAKGFRKLFRLGLDSFGELVSIKVEEGALPRLVQLIIQRCKMLQNLPSGIEQLTRLKVLEFLDVHDDLIKKLEQAEGSEVHQQVAHIPEVRYGCCTDDGWDVKSLERSGKKKGSNHHGGNTESSELPRCWK